jgi:intraflagellar transport protein 122
MGGLCADSHVDRWNPDTTSKTDILAVADWSQKLSFYMLSGRRVGKERALDFDPCGLSYFSSGEYMVLSGSNRKASLYTKDGVHLTEIADHDGWMWSCAVR